MLTQHNVICVLKVKGLSVESDTLTSINGNIKEDVMVQVFRGGLASKVFNIPNGGLHEGEYAFVL